MPAELSPGRSEIAVVTAADVAAIKRTALGSPSQRARICLHRHQEDLPHQMLIAWHAGEPFPPHRHTGEKSETVQMVEGMLHYFIFEADGRLMRHLQLAPAEAGGEFMVRIPPRTWHMPIPAAGCAVYLETFTGPYDRTTDVEFAPWAPGERDPMALAAWTEALLAGRENR